MKPPKINKARWGIGPWNDEPDMVQWIDPDTGYHCLIRRTPHTGALCGYVRIMRDHPLYHRVRRLYRNHISLYPRIDIHGGVTFVGRVTPLMKRGIWIGFDCSHAFDLAPGTEASLEQVFRGRPRFQRPEWMPADIYRDIPYVKEQVTSLSQQLKSIAKSAERKS